MQDMIAIVGILETTMIESADKVFGEKTLKLLAEEVFDELLLTIGQQEGQTPKPVSLEIKEKIGALLTTKSMNPASYFSPQFKLGVYVPILGPFLMPIPLVIIAILKSKLTNACKKMKKQVKKEQKEEADLAAGDMLAEDEDEPLSDSEINSTKVKV